MMTNRTFDPRRDFGFLYFFDRSIPKTFLTRSRRFAKGSSFGKSCFQRNDDSSCNLVVEDAALTKDIEALNVSTRKNKAILELVKAKELLKQNLNRKKRAVCLQKDIEILCESDESTDYGDDYEEERCLFEELKLTAVSVLSGLTKVIKELEVKQEDDAKQEIELREEIQSICEGTALSDTFTEQPDNKNNLVIPDTLYNFLLSSYSELIKGVPTSNRKWQTDFHRSKHNNSDRDNNNDPIDENMEEIISDKGNRITSTNIKSNIDSFHSIEKKGSRNKTGSRDSVFEKDRSITPSVIACRKESKVPNIKIASPKTRAERFHSYIDKVRGGDTDRPFSRSSKGRLENLVISRFQGGKEKESEGSIAPNHTINFCISSASEKQKDWIKGPNGNDLEHLTLIEWAQARLHESIKKRNAQEAIALEKKCSNPLVLCHYGDKRLDHAAKFKKNISVEKLLQSGDQELKLFCSTLPDSTKMCYYPCGKLAVCAVRSHFKGNGRYHLIYDNNNENTMLGCFTPIGRGCIYSSKNTIRFLATRLCGFTYDEHGVVSRQWRWIDGRVQPPLVLQINKYLSIRCVNQTTITLVINAIGETTSFQLGLSAGEKNVSQEELGFMKTSDEYESLAANQLSKTKRLSKDDRKGKLIRRLQTVVKSDQTEATNEDRAFELAEKFPERQKMDFGLPHIRHLYKLQQKIKNVASEWMETYRIITGIKAPVKVIKKRLNMQSATSLPDHRNASDRVTSRAPSAPPFTIHSTKQNGMRSKETKRRPHTSAGFKDDDVNVHSEEIQDWRSIGSQMPTDKKVNYLENINRRLVKPKQTPFRCGIPQYNNNNTCAILKDGCPLALKHEILGKVDAACRCSKRKIPIITDLEFDVFISSHVPKCQLIVISITSNEQTLPGDCHEMLDYIHYQLNKCRTYPCLQSKYDPFRILRYVIPPQEALSTTGGTLLEKRHNVLPGMFLMYLGGRVRFADYVFNGYGNAKQDFLKQVSRTRREALLSRDLPPDFKFNVPTKIAHVQIAWGKEICNQQMDPKVEAVALGS